MAYQQSFIPFKAYPHIMQIHDESLQEIDEAITYLADGIRVASDFRKEFLRQLLDQMLDARNNKGR